MSFFSLDKREQRKNVIREVLNFSVKINNVLQSGPSYFHYNGLGMKYLTENYVITRECKRSFAGDHPFVIWEIAPRSKEFIFNAWYHDDGGDLPDGRLVLPLDRTQEDIFAELVTVISNYHKRKYPDLDLPVFERINSRFEILDL